MNDKEKISLKEKINKVLFKYVLIYFIDMLIFAVSLFISFEFRLGFALSKNDTKILFLAMPIFLIVKFISFQITKVYTFSWRYVGIRDLVKLINGNVIASFFLFFVVIFLQNGFLSGFPRGVIFIDFFITLSLVAFVRSFQRIYFEGIKKEHDWGNRTLIVGAGNAGEQLARNMSKVNKDSPYKIIGFLDDDEKKKDLKLHNYPILGKIKDLEKVVQEEKIESVIIAIPSMSDDKVNKIIKRVKKTDVEEIKILPSLINFRANSISIADANDWDFSDLIGRKIINIDTSKIFEMIKDNVVLITGAAGSIGSEITRQVLKQEPAGLVLFEIDETEIFNLKNQLQESFPKLIGRIEEVVGDISDERRVREILKKYKPDLIFHAAAYKHVPLMETNSTEAAKVNVLGTSYLAKWASEMGVKKFIMISTDKAVNPTSVMGATKRVAENICKYYNQKGNTRFSSVRFGNVLASRGSVVHIFINQIKKGGPVEVTHENMKRYFMTIPEAVSLVLQAAIIGNGGDVLVLDMGKPVKIIDLAKQLIRMMNFEPEKDIPIEIVGLRPGEKLYEEYLTSEEDTISTKHKDIYISKNGKISISDKEFSELILSFKNIIFSETDIEVKEEEMIELLKQYIPTFNHKKNDKK